MTLYDKALLTRVQLTDSNGSEYPTDPVTGALEVLSSGEIAAINDEVVCRWVNNKVPGDAQVVLTDGPSGDQPGIYYNLQEGEIVLVKSICVELLTLSDTVEFELGSTDQANGAGTFTPKTPKWAYKTGAANDGFDGRQFPVNPPAPFRYADGVRSITFRVDCNDASTEITITWHGYIIQTS